ncbi:hypothetical protein D9619_010356 [Psilocybe cf. subviscida]|uniref:Uncharacterized protein n=1 Tax=Psilocybe cf. subviscida TaxID=2480587 RepID=A0A8H5ASH3_9AGAR|nr:hypothetical protein D9619_010356 [Psilocybe cf. subviscida]
MTSSREKSKSWTFQDGHNRIPGDVMLEIVSHLGPPLMYTADGTPPINVDRHRTLRDLALVCREYHHHLLPFLFETIYVRRALNSAQAANPPSQFYARFCRSVVDGDKRARTLATHVRTYVIVGSPQSHTRGIHDFAFSTKALTLFPNLRELQVYGLSITNDFLSAAVSLPPLQVLRIEGCRVPEAFDESLLKKFSILQVRHLYDHKMTIDIYNDATVLAENNQSQQLIRHYPMSCVKYLTSGDRTHFDFLNGLASSHAPMDQLEHVKFNILEINEIYPEALSDFLKVAPALRTLHIEEIQYRIDNTTDFTLVPNTAYPTLPKLEYLHANLPALVAIIPGSSVSSIGIAKESIWPEMLMPVYDAKGTGFWKPYAEAFIKSRKPIVSMDVPMNFYISIQFANYFLDLRSLTIRPKHMNWYNVDRYVRGWSWPYEDLALDGGPDEIIALFLDAWDSHPQLTELQFLYDRFDLNPPDVDEPGDEGFTIGESGPCAVSENTLNRLRQRIPSLKSVTFLNPAPRSFDGDHRTFRFSVR